MIEGASKLLKPEVKLALYSIRRYEIMERGLGKVTRGWAISTGHCLLYAWDDTTTTLNAA